MASKNWGPGAPKLAPKPDKAALRDRRRRLLRSQRHMQTHFKDGCAQPNVPPSKIVASKPSCASCKRKNLA